MKKRLVVLCLMILAIGSISYAVTYRLATSESRSIATAEEPELQWLKKEFGISDENFRLALQVHRRFDPECQARCMELAKTQQEIKTLLASKSAVDEEVSRALEETERLRKMARQSTLEHMYEMARFMDAEAADRYCRLVVQRVVIEGLTPHLDKRGAYRRDAESYRK